LNSVRTLFFIFVFAAIGHSAQAQQKDEVTPSGSYQFNLDKVVSIYPNPAIDLLTVKFESPIAKRTKITVHNVIGNLVEVETEAVDEFEIRLKVKDLPVGYYILALRDEQSNGRSTIKFVKR